jgi:NTE family protein
VEGEREDKKMRFLKIVLSLILLTVIMISCTLRETQPPPVVEPPPVITPPRPHPAKIALVLGAGASKGFAHVGVIKVLEANKIPIHMIVGTSVGSAVGSLYAYGFDAFQLQKMTFAIEKSDIVDLILPDNGFIKGEKLEEFINKTLKNTPMEKLKIPFYAVATDVQSGQEMVFGKGNTGSAVRASCSIPGIFRPVKIGDRFYVDGGVVSPLAVAAAKKMGADIVIAVDICTSADRNPPENTIDTLLQSFNIMYLKLASIQVSQADVVIRPKVSHIGSGDFSKRHEAIFEGEKAATAALPEILKIMNQLRVEGRLE